MDQAAWVAHFAAAGRAQMDAEMARLVAKIRRQHESDSAPKMVAHPVVLVAGHEVDPSDPALCPRSGYRVVLAAGGAGWHVRTVRSVAAHPLRGRLEVVTVRCRRHDERCFATWTNGAFDHAWYLGDGGIERLGMARVAGKRVVKIRGVLDAIEGIRLTCQDVMTETIKGAMV